jgi:hypothetical protein
VKAGGKQSPLKRRLTFNGLHGVTSQKIVWKKEKAVLYPVEVPLPIANSFHVTTMARKHSVLNLREINRNKTLTALASVLTYY